MPLLGGVDASYIIDIALDLGTVNNTIINLRKTTWKTFSIEKNTNIHTVQSESSGVKLTIGGWLELIRTQFWQPP